MKNYILSSVAILLAIVALGIVVFRQPVSAPIFGSGSVATFSEGQATSTSVTINTTSTLIFALKATDSYRSICNTSSTPVWVSFTNPAIVNKGILINPMGSSTNTCLIMSYPSLDNGNIWGVTGAASGTVSISAGAGM